MYYSPAYTVASHKEKREIMKADSGASKTYLKEDHKDFLQNHRTLKHGPTATLPDGS